MSRVVPQTVCRVLACSVLVAVFLTEWSLTHATDSKSVKPNSKVTVLEPLYLSDYVREHGLPHSPWDIMSWAEDYIEYVSATESGAIIQSGGELSAKFSQENQAHNAPNEQTGSADARIWWGWLFSDSMRQSLDELSKGSP